MVRFITPYTTSLFGWRSRKEGDFFSSNCVQRDSSSGPACHSRGWMHFVSLATSAGCLKGMHRPLAPIEGAPTSTSWPLRKMKFVYYMLYAVSMDQRALYLVLYHHWLIWPHHDVKIKHNLYQNRELCYKNFKFEIVIILPDILFLAAMNFKHFLVNKNFLANSQKHVKLIDY